MSKLRTAARILLGFLFLVFALNFFFHFLPMPMPPEQALKYMGGLMAAPYFFPVLKATEIVSSVLLLSGFAVPFALVLLSPIVVQIFLYHVFLDPSGAPLAIALVFLTAFLGFSYFDRYRSLFTKG